MKKVTLTTIIFALLTSPLLAFAQDSAYIQIQMTEKPIAKNNIDISNAKTTIYYTNPEKISQLIKEITSSNPFEEAVNRTGVTQSLNGNVLYNVTNNISSATVYNVEVQNNYINYSYAMTNCSGTVNIGETKTCHIDWTELDNGQYKKVGKLNIQYKFIASYSTPVDYTIIQKLSDNAQQIQGGTLMGGLTGYIPFSSFNKNAQEYHIVFQPANPFILEMSGDCEGKVPTESETKTCVATFRLSPPPASVPTPNPVTPTTQLTSSCSQDIWSCGDYGICSVAGIQSRSCTKTFDCPNAQTAIPTTDKSCQPVIQPQPAQNNQNPIPKPVLERIESKKSVTIPVVNKIEIKKQGTEVEKTEKPKESVVKVSSSSQESLTDQNITSSTTKEKSVNKPSVVNRIFRWFFSFF